MSTLFLACFSLAALSGDEPSRSGIAWSPSGEWTAFTLPVLDLEPDANSFRLINLGPATADAKVETKATSEKTRLWLVRVSGEGSALLDECEGALTAPAWRPDGTALAYGKLTVDPKTGAGRFSIVVRDGSSRVRSLWSIELTDARAEIGRTKDAVLAWSPDGKTLAAPRLKPEGLVIIRFEDGKVLKQLDSASLPSFSPTGDRLAYQRTAASPPTIELIDAEWGAPRHIADLFVFQPPAWTREGDALLVVAPQGVPWRQVDISRLDCETEQTVALRTLAIAQNFNARTPGIAGGSLAMDSDRAEWFATVAQPGQASRISRGTSIAPNMGMRMSGPIAPSPVWSLSVAPRSKRLALRVGPFGLVAFWDPNSEILSPIAPDDATARVWLGSILDDVRIALEETYAPPTVKGKVVSRPTFLPFPGEATLPGDGLVRLRKLVKIGRPLCERSTIWRDPKTGAIEPTRDETRLIFAALDDDPLSALLALDGVESQARNGEDRLRLLALRGQLLLVLGEVERARGVADYLRPSADDSIARGRIESTTHGEALIVEDSVDASGSLLDQWNSLLRDRLVEVERQSQTLLAPGSSDASSHPTRVHRLRVERPKTVRGRGIPSFSRQNAAPGMLIGRPRF